MYSPKVKEDLIPRLYRLARFRGVPMTRIVDDILRPAITSLNETGLFREIEKEEQAIKELADHIKSIITDRKKKTADIIQLLRKIA